jgi:2-C-methyl-D-erythritol 4-phosphate cytidylyltransferase
LKSKNAPPAAAVLVAAGRGRRFGGPKAFARLGAKPLALRPLELLAGHPDIARVVLVAPGKGVQQGKRLLRRAGVSGEMGKAVKGGPTRHASVRLGVEALGDWQGLVLVHDAARPLVKKEHVTAVLRAAASYGAAALARPLVDTIARSKRSGTAEGLPTVAGYARREKLCAMETPQAFRRSWWEHAIGEFPRRTSWTDETTLLRAAGLPVRLVCHDGFNPKITTREDLEIAERLVRTRGGR